MNAPFQFYPERTIRIEGGAKPSGPLRQTALFRFRGYDGVGVPGKAVRHLDKVFEPVVERDGSFRVPEFDNDVFHAVVVGADAKVMIAVGRYLDSVHGTVVGSFVCPATPSDIAEFASRAAPVSSGKSGDVSRQPASGSATAGEQRSAA